MHVSSSSEATKTSGLVIFQTIDLSKFKDITSIKVVYHVKTNKGNNDLFKPFVSPQECASKKNRFEKKISSSKSEAGEWAVIAAEIKDTVSCNNIFVGFSVMAILDLNIDDIQIFINGQKVHDLPMVITPTVLPKVKDMGWLKNRITKIKTASDDKDLSDLTFLTKTIGNAEVVGFGESTHGTKEFNTLKRRIIKYLVDSLGFDIIAFENNIIPTHQVNRMFDSSNSSRVVLDSLFGRIHQTEEIAELFDYIKERNKTGKKVIVEGFDMQGYAYETKLLLKLFETEDTVLYNQVQAMEQYRLTTMFTTGKFDTLFQKACALYSLYTNRVKDNSNGNIKGPFVSKLIEAIRDAYYFNYLKYLPISKGGDAIRASTYRDSIMSENILWLRKNYPNKKIIVWAHDAHIKRGVHVYAENFTLGHFLNAKLGSRYKAYSFTAGHGTATGYAQYGQPKIYNLQQPMPDTYEYYLSNTGVGIGFWNLEVKQKELAKYRTLVSGLKLRLIGYNFTQGEQFIKVDLANSYNGLFFIDRSTNSKSLHFRSEQLSK